MTVEVFGHTVDNYFAALHAHSHINRVLKALEYRSNDTKDLRSRKAIEGKVANLRKLQRQLRLLFPA